MFLEKTHVEHYIIAVVVLVDDDVIVINDITVNWSISKCSFFFFLLLLQICIDTESPLTHRCAS